MGLIKSIVSSVQGTLADQWVDFITCDSMSENILLVEGGRLVQDRSGNKKYSENIITNGSKINVADGQCMLICENGAIVDFCAEPGQYTYNNQIQPSLLSGGFKDLGNTFAQVGKRFIAGGAPTDQQKVYYVNTKEIFGNKIGFGNIPFRDGEFGFTVKVQGFGSYTFKITNPLLFYKNVVGNISGSYDREKIIPQMKDEVISALNPALGKISSSKIPYDQLPQYPVEIGKALNESMSNEWKERRGIEIESLAISSLTVSDESAKKIEQFQEARVLSNPALAAGRMTAGTVNAMETAAGNEAGAMTGFMGMGFAQNAMGNSASGINNMFGVAQQQGYMQPQPQTQTQQSPSVQNVPQSTGWVCVCGNSNTSGFCSNCGKPKEEGWTCACGSINKGKFCSTCGTPKPTEALLYKCDKCGWMPQDPKTPPKFCPECGDIFNDSDTAK